MTDPTMQGIPPGVEAARYSLAEIDAQCRKAARGAGCPWGMAEEAGKAARWLAAQGLPGPEALAALLDSRERCCCAGGTPCALRIGAEAADRGRSPGEDAPLLILAVYALHHGGGAQASAESRRVDADAWATLERYAARTYVPASDASRQGGAGAGLTDND